MTSPIKAVTKNRQSNETIHRMAERALGVKVQQMRVTELAGGLSNAVYAVEADGKKMVLKVASDASVITMRHERDYVPIEAKMLSIIERSISIPAPKLICFDDSGTLCKAPYFFMTFIEGQALSTLEPKPSQAQLQAIHREVALISSKICSIKAPCYGIPALPETHTQSNREFVQTLFRLLLADLSDKGKPLSQADGITRMLQQSGDALEAADAPCLAHTDTWDGNLMVKDGKLTGLVDYAAILYGDPLITHDFHNMWADPAPEILEAFGIRELDSAMRLRIQVYRVWQLLGMVAECAFRQYEDPNQYAWVAELFHKNLQTWADMLKEQA